MTDNVYFIYIDLVFIIYVYIKKVAYTIPVYVCLLATRATNCIVNMQVNTTTLPKNAIKLIVNTHK